MAPWGTGRSVGPRCEHFAKSSPQTVLLPKVLAQPDFELRANAHTTRVLLDSTGRRATSVLRVDARSRGPASGCPESGGGARTRPSVRPSRKVLVHSPQTVAPRPIRRRRARRDHAEGRNPGQDPPWSSAPATGGITTLAVVSSVVGASLRTGSRRCGRGCYGRWPRPRGASGPRAGGAPGRGARRSCRLASPDPARRPAA